MKNELTKKILEYVAKTPGDEISPAEVCRITQRELMEHIELKPVTAPFVLFVLEDIVKALSGTLTEKERETYEAIRAAVSSKAYTVRFATPFERGEEREKDERA